MISSFFRVSKNNKTSLLEENARTIRQSSWQLLFKRKLLNDFYWDSIWIKQWAVQWMFFSYVDKGSFFASTRAPTFGGNFLMKIKNFLLFVFLTAIKSFTKSCQINKCRSLVTNLPHVCIICWLCLVNSRKSIKLYFATIEVNCAKNNQLRPKTRKRFFWKEEWSKKQTTCVKVIKWSDKSEEIKKEIWDGLIRKQIKNILGNFLKKKFKIVVS